MSQVHQPIAETREAQFIRVACPVSYEGVGNALQAAFRDRYDMPRDMQDCLQRLDQVRR